ncbi:exocyst complex component EXO70A1-like [Lycium ferocissimum]|uniref:exocyst complex component EXO70A1-like n=1 Tax=Lycium ferocissimum TaxID=112874 RepID=UPI0028160EC7|nr:exocyst complex component EXO70A1-like [Lycium ferocissimum]
MAAYAVVMENLKERAEFMNESMQKSQTITDNMISILGSFDHRLSALETAMRPTQIRTHSIRKAHENIDKTLKVAESILAQFDLARQTEAKILRGPHEDLESYLEAVNQLRSIVKFFSSTKGLKSSIGMINHASSLLAKSVLKLEEEFRQLLTLYSKPVEPDRLFDCLPQSLRPSTGSPSKGDGTGTKEHQRSLETVVYHPPALIPPRILPLLHELAQQMIQAGHQQQLYTIYKEIRSAVVEQSLRKLGVERLGKEDVQKMQWEVLEAKIGNWIHFMRISVKLLFAAEKKVSDQIFEGQDSLRDQCFAEVTGNSVAVLLSFGEAIAKSKRSPEKLFVLLDMYEIMRELQSEMDIIFGSQYCSEMREAAKVLTDRLAETAQETFVDFEEAVEKDATKTSVLDGTVHPLTSYVINYVKFLFDYQSTLKQLFGDANDGHSKDQLGVITTRILQALQSNLDGKSKQYKDPALTQLFLMNNIHYIVRSVRRSEAKDVLGDDWVQIHRRVVQQHANQYKRISWSKILQTLSVQGASPAGNASFTGEVVSSNTGISRSAVKDRFKTFNMLFEEIHQRQSQWTVPDSELRESLRLAVAEVLLPAYRSFAKRFGPMIEGGKNPQKYIRYTPEDLERMLAEFFEGKTWKGP